MPSPEPTTAPTPRQYAVFISYRHDDNKEPGRQWATWLHHTLETYEVPPDLVGRTNLRGEAVPASLYPVFRDEEELPADADLTRNIQRALENSALLVVLCSPRAVASRFVADEIRYFKELGKSDKILALLIDGEPNASRDPTKQNVGLTPLECLPEPLRFGVAAGLTGDAARQIDWSARTEPIAADARPGNQSQEGYTNGAAYRESLSHHRGTLTPAERDRRVHEYEAQLELAKLKIIAGALGLALGELTQRDKAHQLVRARQRARTARRLAAVFIVLTLTAAAGAAIAWRQRKLAVENAQHAEEQRKLATTNADRAEEQRKLASANEKVAQEQRQNAEANAREARRQLLAFYEERGREELMAGAPDKAAPYLLEAWDGSHGHSRAEFLLGIAMRPLLGQRFTLDGHLESLEAVAWSPDGQRIATADHSGVVMLWNAQTGARLATFHPGLRISTGPGRGLGFSPDGTRLLAATDKAFLFDCASGNQLVALEHGYGTIEDFAFSADGALLATASNGAAMAVKPDGIRVWQLPEGKLLASLGVGDDVRSVRFTADHQRLLTCADKGGVQVWDWAAGKVLHEFHTDLHVREAVFGADEKTVFASGGTALLCAWSLEDEKELLALPDKSTGVDNTAPFLHMDAASGRLFAGFFTEDLIIPTKPPGAKPFSIQHGFGGSFYFTRVAPDASAVFTSSGKIGEIWRGSDGKWQTRLSGHDARIGDAAFSSDGRQIVTAGDDRRAIVWDWPKLAAGSDLEGFQFFVNQLCLGASGDDWLGVATNYESSLWRPGTGELIARLDHPDEDAPTGSPGDVLSTVWNRPQRLAATVGRGKFVRLWDAQTGKQKFQLAHPSRPVSACFTPDGHLLATSTQYDVRLWETGTGQLIRTLPKGASGWRRLVFDPTGAKLLAIDSQGSASVWSTDGERLYSLSNEFGPLRDGEFTPDGSALITFGADEPIARLWEAAEGRLRASFGPHAQKVHRVACSPDSHLLATEGGSGVTYFWDLRTGKLLAQWENKRRRAVDAIAFFPQGDVVAAAVGSDLFVVDANTGTELAAETFNANLFTLEFTPDGRSLFLGAGAQNSVIFRTLLAPVGTKPEVTTQMNRIGHWKLRDGRLVVRSAAEQ